MYVGLIDQDLLQGKKFLPNLETMQLSTYHKQKKDIVELILDSKSMDKYDKLYLIKNKNDKIFLSKAIADPRTTCIGLGFTNGNFIPRPEIDSLVADTTIYDKYINEHYNSMSKANQKRCRELKQTDHFRVNLGNDQFNWARPQNKRAKIYDTEPFQIQGIFEYCSNNYRKVLFTQDCQVYTFEELLQWLNAEWLLEENEIYYKGYFDDKFFKDFVNAYHDHRKAAYFTIDLTNIKTLRNEFVLWLNRSLYALTRNCYIKIYIPYKTNDKFYNYLFDKIKLWNNHRDRGKSFLEMMKKTKYRQEFDNLLKIDYNINRMVQIIPNQYKKESNWNYVD